MGRRALVGTVATLGLVAIIGLFASLSLLFSSPVPAYAQGTNNAPAFLDDNDADITETTRSVDENTAAYTNIGDPVTATDSDTDDRLTYSIKNARTSPFTIVRATGQLQVGQPLDHETKSSYEVVVQVTDSEDADGNFEIPAVVDDTITVTITVNDLEEPGKISLSWTRPQPHANSAVTPTLTDPDGSVSVQSWKWQILDGGWSDILNATSETYTPAPGDVNKHIRAVATYTDRRASGKMAESETAYVRPVPSTNPAPDFQVNNSGGYSCPQGDAADTCVYVRKSYAAGSEIYYPGYVDITDNDQVRYSLSDTTEGSKDAALFRIDALRGDLYTTAAHIYDNPSDTSPSNGKFRITITATDPSGLAGSIKVAITPSGGGSPPVVNGPSLITYPENGTWTLATYTATAANQDGTSRPIEGWIIGVEPGGGDGDFFDIDDDGNLTFTQPPDYENPADEDGDNRYSFNLHVYDTNPPGGGRPVQTFFNVTVTVADETVEALEIDGPTAVRYAENGTGPVGTYSLLRANAAVDDWVLSGADADQFNIDDTTGELIFKRSPDYENPTDVAEENTYRLTITAYAGTESKTEFIFIRVSDVNEPPEFDEGTTATRSVERDAQVGDPIGAEVTATDPDGDFPTYSLPDADTLPFSISEYTGQLSLSGALASNKSSYLVAVIVTDNDPDSSEDDRIIVTVNVGDEGGSNNVPEFPAAAVTFSIDENTATVEDVGDPVVATDDDNDTPTYSLGGTDAGFFTIVDTSGQIQTKTGQTYDFETKPSYSVTVTADDSNGGTADKAVTITLINVEEAGTVTLSTNQPSARAAITATLTDPDNGITGTTWQWSKSDSQNGTYDNISSATSATYIPADGDVGKFLKATASYDDDEGSGRSVEASTTSAVQSGTNRAPDFGDLTATRDVAENTAANGNVGAVVGATDLDSDDLAYSLTSTDASSFTVDNTGQIKVGATTMLDYESAKNTYTVVVQVTDSKDAAGNTETNPTIDDTIAVTINVTDVEEAGTVTLSNYQPPARVEITATLTDPDGGVTNTTWQWARTLDPANNPWQDITGATSSSYTPPDTDLTYYLRATASYTDRRGIGKKAEKETTQAVGVGTNRSPDFGATNATRSFPENTAANTNIGDAVEADDPDTGNTLTYTLEGTDKDSFDIDSSSGQIKTKSGVTYDHEDDDSYSVTVKADDNNGGTDTIDVTITVIDVNEKPTFDETSPTTRSISESAGTGADIGSAVSATDQDGDTLIYTLGGTDVASFDIVSTSGQLQTKVALDKETKVSYEVTVSVRDSKADDGTADSVTDDTITVNITVTDANDAPQFSADSITRRVRENTSVVEDLGGRVTATDGDNDTLTYSLDTAGATSFDIDSTSGQIKTKAGVTYDHEATPSYSVTVTADDNNGGTDTKEVTIDVTDVDEPPLKPGKPTVSRTPNNGVSVTWTAPDNTGRPAITHYQYQYKKSAEPDWSGATFTTSGPTASVTIVTLDAGTSYDVEVRAINDEGPGPWSDTGTGSTNSPPDFSGATADREVDENTVGVTSIGAPVTASDADLDDLAYTLEGTDANFFQIVPGSGQIQTKADVTYDHEAKPSYTVTVKADDSNGGTDTIDVTITVTDVNEAPAFDGPTTAREVPENTGADTEIGSPVEAEDPDAGATLTYLLSGTDASSFDIDTLTGQLKTKDALDHETKPTYTIIVSVLDSKDDSGNSDTVTDDTIDVTITVTDVNDAPEFPSTGANARSIAENTVANTNIGSPVRATDADNDNLTYTLEGTDHGSFSIDELSGQLKTKNPLDHEAKDSYTVTVKASDGNGGTDATEVTITVTNVNEAPSFDSETATRNVPENTAANQPVGPAVSAVDVDAGDRLAYSLGGTDSASFGINGSTGQITVGTGTTPDFETTTRYEVTVTATDSSNLSDTITVTINVTEGNDPPVFATDTATRSVAENTGTGQNIGAPFEATDAEEETLTYTLEGTDAASFDIVATSGQLQTKDALDYETKSSYSVTVKAADSSASGTIDVTITVTDVNEPPLAPGQLGVSEESADSVSATWTAPANAGRPSIAGYDYQYKKTDEQTWSGATYATDGVVTSITITGLDSSTSYDVQARAKNDEGTSPWSATGAGSTGNTTPAFSSPTVTREVAENTPADVNIGDPVTATDDDNGDSLTYTLGGADAASFDIDSKTGQLKTKAPLDHEGTKNTYTVMVTATDSADAPAEATATITVTDVNELPAFLSGETGFRVVDENTATGQVIGDPVGATDPDDGDTLIYTLGGTNAASFAIVASTGQLQANAALDYETKSNYSVTVSVSDGKDAEGIIDTTADATIPVTIVVDDVNEPPEFDPGTATRTIAENTAADQNIGSPFTATDPDDYTLSYSLGGTDAAIFRINASTGQLQTRGPLDHEGKPSYSVTVSVHDGKDADGTPSQAPDDTVTVTITVTDVEEDGTLTLSSVQPQVDTALTATLEDPDGSVTITTWLWESSSDKANWTIISGATGAAYTPAASDVDEHLRATATYTDSRGPSKSASVTSDNPVRAAPPTNAAPTFSGTSTARSVEENTVPGANIGAPVTATDSNTDKLTYSLGGTDAASFGIVQASGQLLTKEPLDYESAKRSYTVTVTATDPFSESDTIEVTITVTNVNEAPSVTVITPTVYFVENASGPVATYGATDPDMDIVMWNLAAGSDSDAFSISSKGVLTFKTPPDYENPVDADTNNVYMVTVEASDGPNTDDLAVTITVTDVDEPPLAPGQPVVSEESASSVSVTWTAPANDGRPAIMGYDYQYKKTDEQSWSGATYATDRVVTSITITGLDSSTSYDVQARAKNDEGTSPWSATGADSTGNTDPAFSSSAVTRDVAENTPANTNIGDPFAATDDDNGDSLTYTLGGADAASFDIDSKTGQLKTKAPLDHEGTKNTYTVIVTATDSANASDIVEVFITVTDVNEPPVISRQPTVNYPENGTGPVAIYTVTDPDSGTITWSLRGEDTGDFSINDGTLKFVTPPNFEEPADHDLNNVYHITVTASDEGIPQEVDVTVTVTDVNESPQFPSTEKGARSVAENTSPDTNIGDPLEASDPDDGDALTYRVTGADASYFGIVAGSGQLQTKAALDYETKASYTVTVIATDEGNLTDTIPVTITVTNVDEPGTVTLSSLQPQAGTAITAALDDPDGGVTGDTWKWESSSDQTTWASISGATAAEYMPIVGDVNKYLRATANYTDELGPSKSAQKVSANKVRAAPPTNSPPAFSAATATRSVEENAVPDTNVGTPVSANDPDFGDTLTYALSGTNSASFDIVRATGQLKTKVALDRETKATYTVTVTATDPSGLFDTIEVTINVANVNEAPVVTVTAPVRYPENSTGAVAFYTASDPDSSTINWSLLGDDKGLFSIANGVLAFKTPPDYENPGDADDNNVYQIIVQASDETNADSVVVAIVVIDVNEPPAFGQGPHTRNIAENTAPGQNIGSPVAATDDDNGDSLTYTLGGTDAASFAIDALTGQLKTKAPLDHEAPKNTYTVTVTATDSAGVTASATVTITVTDVNEPPSFGSGAGDRTVAENTAPGGPVGLPVSAEDDDAGDTLTYSMAGADSASFGIDSETGLIKVGARSRLDFEDETKTTYEVTVTATDSSHLSTTITVTIEVLNVNEDGVVTLSQLQPQVDTAVTASLDDPDGMVSGLTWKWEISSDNTNWAAIAGATSASYTPVASDLNKFLRVTASYSDGEGANKTAQAAAAHAVQDVPATNAAPEFPSSENGTRTVVENTGASQNVGAAVEATDTDQNTLTYKLSGVDAPSFFIVADSGQIQTKAPLDHEAKSTYTVTVTATDPSGESDDVTVTITVSDVDEPPLAPGIPAITQNSETSLTMAWTAPSSTGRPAVTDYDYQYKKTTENTWTEVTNTAITGTSVEITGLETTTYYHVQVRATNDEGTGDWSDSGIGITRTLPNTPPEFPGSTTERHVTENTEDRQNVGNPVDARDTDNDDLTYILEGTDADSFMIDDESGQLKTKMPLDHEAKSDYSVLVKAEDGRGGSDTIGVTIKVTNVNEKPKFAGNLGVHSVLENTTPGVDIGAPVTATDPENDPLTYSLDSAGAQVFDIDASTGQLQTKAALDYETARVHSVTVYVSDRKNAQGATDTATDDDISVTITVTNVNEPPAFTEAAPSRSVAENSAIGTDVGYPVTAADPDGDTLTYSLDGTDKASFSIDTSSGQLKTRTELDYESPKKIYTVTVSVSDGKNADGNADTTADATVTVTIAVTDVNEPPTVTIASTVRYAENGADPVDTYTATDPERGTITWTLSGTDMDDFRISKVNDKGVLEFRTPPNFEDPADADDDNVYLVAVEVSDGNTSDALQVTVTVFNVNEPPAFPAETGNRSIDENTAAGQNLGDAVAAADPEGHTLTYKLAGPDAASFIINRATGQLRTRAPLDFETKRTYLVTVHVRDSKDQDDRVNAVTDDTIDITININNIDEDGWIVLSSRQPQIDTPFRATIEDPDGGVTSTIWKWESSPNKSTWTVISGQTSASYTPLTADGGKYLRVTASYTDGHGANKNAQKVSDNPVRVTPDSNVAPAFASNTATRSVDEGTVAGQNIGAPVAATDADPADGSLLTYSLTGPDAASFEIVRATGQLLTKAPLDHETKATYTVTVTAVDPSLMPAIILVTITVNDVDEPLVLSGPDVVDYPENGTDAVAQYTADDPEDVATIIWSLDGDDKDLFDITGGELTFKSSPDHDVAGDKDGNNVYLVTVTASDGTTPVTLAVEVTVSNVNEAPEFPASETGDRTVAENTAADENIGDPVAATDPDSGDTLTYTPGGSDAGSFAIDETTGQLKTKDTLNYEAKDTYTVTVTATDSSGLSDTITVTVTVSSVNEVPEFPGTETGQRSVAENTPAAQDIGAPVAATDPEGETLTYALGGDDAASFAIDGATGQLKTRDPLDYETKASYSVTVSVSDGKDIDGNADTSADNTIDVTITVTNLAEAGKVILSSLQPQVGTPLTATLVDPDDATNVNWTWGSSSNWSSGWTPISNATSDTYTPVTGDLNKYLRATATYTNSGGTRVSAYGISAYPVRAAPASNVVPAFAAATATRSVSEDAPVGSAVGDPVTATDTDADDVLTYTLSGTDAESFSIGMASGQLRTKAALDHDTKASYTVVVTAADPSGLFDTITVTISVTDQNEPPVISGKASVYYAEGRTDTVAIYTATDPENGQITWSLAGDDSGDFLISSTGVLTFNTPPDSENPADADTNNVYLVTVQASDGTNTSALDVTVTVTDEADPPPAPDAPTVQAAATDGHTALSVSWQAPTTTGGSPITGYEVEYRKQGSEDWSSENATVTGVIAAITSVLPDTTYEVQVRAENADGWGAWSEPGTGRTEVTPLGQQVDLTVSYQAAGYTVNEGATRAVSVTLFEAADRALQIPITVAPVTAESSDYQVIGLTGGALSFVPGDSTKSFTFEGLQDTDTSDETVTLGLGQLPDKVTAGTRSTAVVTIDDDDPVSSPRRRSGGGSGGGGGGGGNFGSSSPGNKAPVFTEGDSATRSVAENTAAGVNIGTPVTATDADRDMLTYTVGGDDGSAFSVDGATGQLKTKSALDFETKSSYRVTMGVTDSNGGGDTITVTITVSDVADVPLTSGATQMIGVVDSERDTTVSTLDGGVAVTFPSGSRGGDYQVRLDYGVTNCNANFSGEELWFCLTVDIFDNAGNLEQGVILSRPATIKIRRNGDERGGVDAVLGLHAQGGVSVYTRGRTGGEWTESAFTLESDGVGGIVITITGVSSFGLYAGTTDSSVPVQVSHQVATVPVPTATPQNTGGQGSSPEPTPTPTPTPQPGSSPEQSTTPDPTPTPAPVVTRGTNPTPEPTLGHQVSYPFGPLGGPAATPTPAPTPVGIAKGFGNLASAPPPDGDSVPTAEPEVKVASFDSEGGKSGGMPSWYVAMIMLALAATIAGGSTYVVKRRSRVSYPVTVQRSREFNKWWSGW